MGQLTRDGQPRRSYWDRSWPAQIVKWASDNGIRVPWVVTGPGAEHALIPHPPPIRCRVAGGRPELRPLSRAHA